MGSGSQAAYLLVLLRRDLLEKISDALPRRGGEAQRLEEAQHLSDGAVEHLEAAVIRLRVDMLWKRFPCSTTWGSELAAHRAERVGPDARARSQKWSVLPFACCRWTTSRAECWFQTRAT